jgi:hypothetical protein
VWRKAAPTCLAQVLAGLGWRPVISLERLAEHDADPERLALDAEADPAERLERGLSLSRFAAALDRAAGAVHG